MSIAGGHRVCEGVSCIYEPEPLSDFDSGLPFQSSKKLLGSVPDITTVPTRMTTSSI